MHFSAVTGENNEHLSIPDLGSSVQIGTLKVLQGSVIHRVIIIATFML